jgi:hypothetical protein
MLLGSSGAIFCPGDMTYIPFDDDDAYRHELPNLWDWTPSYGPTPGYYLDRECTPFVICLSPDPEKLVDRRSPLLHQPQSNPLDCPPVFDREDEGTWDGRSPNCVH